MKKVMEAYQDYEQVFMKVAEGGVYHRPTVVRTVLGSCVSVTFHCQRTGFGAMFHALLPTAADYEKLPAPPELPFRYVDTAIHLLCARIFKRVVQQPDLECKIFGGGAAMVQGMLGVGSRNVQIAYEVLASYPLRVVSSDVAGECGRKLLFVTSTGEVFVKRIIKGQRR